MHELASCFCPCQLYPYDTLCTYGVKQLKLLGFSQRHLFWCSLMEQGTGVEPASAAWEAAVLPMYEPCLFGSWVSYHLLIENATVFWRKRKTGPPMGGPVRYQQSFAPAGMASFSMRRFSFSSPFSLWTADRSMPHDSWPIIFLGGRLITAASVLPTSASGS